MNLNMIKNKVAHATGTENFYRGMIKNSLYTDGMKHFMKLAECYWLYDIIQTEVFTVLRRKDPDTYYLRITAIGSTASITIHDYHGNEIFQKGIKYTSFPEGSMDLIVGWDGQTLITCLPTEN